MSELVVRPPYIQDYTQYEHEPVAQLARYALELERRAAALCYWFPINATYNMEDSPLRDHILALRELLSQVPKEAR